MFDILQKDCIKPLYISPEMDAEFKPRHGNLALRSLKGFVVWQRPDGTDI